MLQSAPSVPAGEGQDWLFFMAQVPAAPSSARGRRARPAEWVLGAAAHRGAFTLLAQLAETVRGQGGSVMLLTARATSAAEREAVLALQLHFSVRVSSLRYRLMSPSPE